jgi:hypothetical protein
MRVLFFTLMVLLIFLVSSCESSFIVKRKYRPGYHVQVLKSKKEKSRGTPWKSNRKLKPFTAILEQEKNPTKKEDLRKFNIKKSKSSSIETSALIHKKRLHFSEQNEIQNSRKIEDKKEDDTKSETKSLWKIAGNFLIKAIIISALSLGVTGLLVLSLLLLISAMFAGPDALLGLLLLFGILGLYSLLVVLMEKLFKLVIVQHFL